MRVLAITVGGSPDPVVTSIVGHKPGFTLFFVTDGPHGGSQRLLSQEACAGQGIVRQTSLSEGAYRAVVIQHPDDFASCYRTVRAALLSEKAEFPDAEFIADYTGGTKTMTAAMAAAASHLGWKLSLVVAPRDDLNRAHLVGAAVVQSIAPLILDEVSERVRLLFVSRNYEGAEAVLTEALRNLALDPTQREDLIRVVNLVRGLGEWDRMAYAEGYRYMQACGVICNEVLPHLAELAKFAQSGSCPPYELVWDLVGNAKGRAAQGRHEDAILRLYRAVELLAQVRLHEKYHLDTGDLDLEKIPGPLREELAARRSEREQVTAGLVDAYRILAALGDPLGKLYESVWDKRIRNLLSLRNKAFMEHGFRPLGEEEWRKAHEIACNFLAAGAEAIKVRMEIPSQPTWEKVAALLLT